MSFAPLNALAAQLGEEAVLAMARAYIDHVTEKRAGISPLGWQPIREQLWRQSLNASVDNLNALVFTIEQAQDAGIPPDDEFFVDAVSRLDALRCAKPPPTCWGCQEGILNQLGHMDQGGCLYTE
jgi:hypothetical protein